MSKQLISLAYYLPQFHEIEENNQWWGQGFTEWQQLNAAQSYFPWQQIRQPAGPFGQYNLLNPEVFIWQQSLADQYQIDGFLVFDYWFGQGKKLLEKPMQMVLEQDLPFNYAFCWANHTWYNKRDNITLQSQQYLGADDYAAYFEQLLPHFQSEHYIKIDGKPVFSIFSPKDVPDLAVFIDTFNDQAQRHGFPGIYWLADNTEAHQPWKKYFDGYAKSGDIFKQRKRDHGWSYLLEKLARNYQFKNLGPFVYSYEGLVVNNQNFSHDPKQVPVVFTGWDTTPRHLKRGSILRGFDVQSFSKHLQRIRQAISVKTEAPSTQVILIKSWNEWAEGNVIEPDQVFGEQLLAAYASFVSSIENV